MKRKINQNRLKKGDILFTYDKISCLSKLIWLVTKDDVKLKARVSHVALYNGNGGIIEADYKGVSRNKLKKYEKNYRIEGGRVTENIGNLMFYAQEHIGIKYSYLQLVVLFFKKILKLKATEDVEKDGMICGEFVASMYRLIGIRLCDGINLNDIAPLDLYNCPEVEKYNVYD